MGVTPKSSTTHGDLGIPHFEKPTSDRTLDFHWTLQVQENRSTWTGWNAISTCNWAKYGANNDSRFLMVVYPRQHQLRQLRCTWFSRRAKDELDVDFVSKPGFATLHINGRIRILSFPVFLGLTRLWQTCHDVAKIDNHDQQRQRWKPAKGGPPDSPVCRPNLRMRSYVYVSIYIYTYTHTRCYSDGTYQSRDTFFQSFKMLRCVISKWEHDRFFATLSGKAGRAFADLADRPLRLGWKGLPPADVQK